MKMTSGCRFLREVFVMRVRAAEKAGERTASVFIRRVRVINAKDDRLTSGWWKWVGVGRGGRKEEREGKGRGSGQVRCLHCLHCPCSGQFNLPDITSLWNKERQTSTNGLGDHLFCCCFCVSSSSCIINKVSHPLGYLNRVTL